MLQHSTHTHTHLNKFPPFCLLFVLFGLRLHSIGLNYIPTPSCKLNNIPLLFVQQICSLFFGLTFYQNG